MAPSWNEYGGTLEVSLLSSERGLRMLKHRFMDFCFGGAGVALDIKDAYDFIAVCSRLFCVVTLDCFVKLSNLHPMHVLLSRSRAHLVVNIM